MAGRRIDDVPDNVFRVSGRINSTWGGGLVDMVRSRRYLEIIERHGYIEQAGETGAWFLDELHSLAARHPAQISNVRGRGLMVAFDLPDRETRDELLSRLRTEEHLIALSSGERAIRFRPALNVTRDELSIAVRALDRVLP